MKTLDMNSPTFAEDLLEAMGVEKGTELVIVGPQFEREDGIKPISNPAGLFEQLHTFSHETLKALGMRLWNESGLMLMPMEWYDHIPEGFEMLSINEDKVVFEKGKTDNDYRMGMLAYGIIPDYAKVKSNE